MLKELFEVMKLVRPQHLLKAVMHPREELLAFKYHYRRVPVDQFISFLSQLGVEGLPKLKALAAELAAHESFHAALKEKLRLHSDGYGGQMTREAPAIYSLVRLLKPKVIVETGVADGFTTSYILRALADNGEGKLYSIDLPHYLLPQDKQPGWIVEEDLRGRWDLRVGDAAQVLPELLKELGTVDMFLHDSLHTYDHMMLEFRAVWPHLRPGGLFLSHDVGTNPSFFDFIEEIGLKWKDWRVYHVLGGFRKPAPAKGAGS